MPGKVVSNEHRFLDHDRPLDAPQDGRNTTLRAAETPQGYCIEYRESLYGHFQRLGLLLDNKREPRLISDLEFGMTRGLKMYGLGMCGGFGDQKKEKPSFFDIIGVMKWDAWENLKGVPRSTCQKMFVKIATEILVEYNYGHMIEQDPKRPGPDYYKDCIKFNWVDTLIKKHKESLTGDGKSIYDFKPNKEDDAAWKAFT